VRVKKLRRIGPTRMGRPTPRYVRFVPSILLVRHGQAAPGQDGDPGLSPLGHQQANAVARTLDAQGIAPVRTASGTLARQTQPLAALEPAAPEPDPRWNEYDVFRLLSTYPPDVPVPAPHADPRGFQEGLDQALSSWMDQAADGPDTWLELRTRVEEALGDLAGELGSGQSAVVVTSGGPIAAVCAGLLGLDVPGTVALHRVLVNTGVTRLFVGRAGLRLASVNEQAHLAGGLLTYR